MMKRMKFIWLGTALLLYATSGYAQITEKAEYGMFAITNATIHTVTDGVIDNGTVLIRGEKIVYVGQKPKITAEYSRIDAQGKHLYPGFMDAGTQLGLQEIGSVAETKDQAELGEFNPHVRAFTAINPSSASIPVTRVNGVTHVISLPVSGRLSGKATLIDLYGYSPDSMAVKPNAALHLNWPSALKRGSWDDRDKEKIAKEYKKNIDQLNEFWKRAAFYQKMLNSYDKNNAEMKMPDTNKKMEAMREVMSGNLPVIISVDRKKDILNAIEWTKKHPDVHFILAGVQEGWRVAEEIA
ncbi:MAG TPA: hypothetical protein VK112_02990, partial [Fodinibius sp.]|nr:hypothetical protein [Fodinibius sp.]